MAAHDDTALGAFDKSPNQKMSRVHARREKRPEKIPGTRRYLSSDGYEILVGRAARDNDQLTFRVARPHDLWLHAGDSVRVAFRRDDALRLDGSATTPATTSSPTQQTQETQP